MRIKYYVLASKRIYNVCLDDECESIIKEKNIPKMQRSEYIRNLIKKDSIPKQKPKVVIKL